MQKYAITLLFLSFTLWQCSQVETAPVATSIKISGSIEEANADKLTIRNAYGSETVAVVDGQFETELPSEGPMLATLYYNRKSFQVFAIPGDSIHVTFNATQIPESLTFTASHSAGNQFLVDFYEGTQKDYKTMYSQPEGAFMIHTDSIRNSLIQRIKKLEAENKELNTTMVDWLKHYADYNYANDLARFENYYTYFTKDSIYEQSTELTAAIETYNQERPELLGLSAYAEFIESKVSQRMSDLMEEDSTFKKMDNPYFTAQMQALDGMFENEKIIDFLTFSALRDQYSYSGVNGTDEYYNALMAGSASPIYKDKVQSLYQEWEHLLSGNEAPGFSYPDIDSNMVSLASLDGKLVYIDVWATWCGPCRAEEPYLEELQHEFEGNDKVAFTSISIDDDKDAWRKWIMEKNPMGLHLIAEAGWESKLNKDYNIKGIPRFILIDQNGAIVNANASRPSSGTLKDKLEGLLAQADLKN